jgi:hypothetical protein
MFAYSLICLHILWFLSSYGTSQYNDQFQQVVYAPIKKPEILSFDNCLGMFNNVYLANISPKSKFIVIFLKVQFPWFLPCWSRSFQYNIHNNSKLFFFKYFRLFSGTFTSLSSNKHFMKDTGCKFSFIQTCGTRQSNWIIKSGTSELNGLINN